MKKIIYIPLYLVLMCILFCFAAVESRENKSGTLAMTDDNKPQDEKEAKSIRQELNELKERMNELEDLKEQVANLKKRVNTISALEISGFFNVSISNYKNKPNIFSIGAFELDIEHNYENFQVAAALVFQEGAEMRVGFIDYHLYGSGISPRGRLFRDEGLHIQVGRFDIPYGNDWQYFSPADRISVTPPLTTEMIMDGGYNDEGIRLLLNFVSINMTLFMLDGIEKKYTYGGNSFGGRIGITPFNNPYILKAKAAPNFELGISYIHDIDRDAVTAEKLYALDFAGKLKPLFLLAEYYYRDKTAGIRLDGYHITGGLDFRSIIDWPLILFARYEAYISQEIISSNYREIADKNSIYRISSGINLNISDISFLKFEYQNYISAYEEFRTDEYYSKMLYYLQLVITF